MTWTRNTQNTPKRRNSCQGTSVLMRPKHSLQELKHHKEIVIKEAHNGGNVMILHINDYVGELKRKLLDPKCYKKLDHNPTNELQEKLGTKLNQWHEKRLLSLEEKHYLYIQHPVPVLANNVFITQNTQTRIPTQGTPNNCRH